jgi:hypothetical protein
MLHQAIARRYTVDDQTVLHAGLFPTLCSLDKWYNALLFIAAEIDNATSSVGSDGRFYPSVLETTSGATSCIEVAAGADLNTQESTDGRTALH